MAKKNPDPARARSEMPPLTCGLKKFHYFYYASVRCRNIPAVLLIFSLPPPALREGETSAWAQERGAQGVPRVLCSGYQSDFILTAGPEPRESESNCAHLRVA